MQDDVGMQEFNWYFGTGRNHPSSWNVGGYMVSYSAMKVLPCQWS